MCRFSFRSFNVQHVARRTQEAGCMGEVQYFDAISTNDAVAIAARYELPGAADAVWAMLSGS